MVVVLVSNIRQALLILLFRLKYLHADFSQIVILSESAAVTVDTTSVFACVASGYPTPSISWSRGGSTLNNSSRFTIYEKLVTEGGVTYSQSILKICRVGQDDAVQYTCSARNSVGTDRASFNLTVNRMCTLVLCTRGWERGCHS